MRWPQENEEWCDDDPHVAKYVEAGLKSSSEGCRLGLARKIVQKAMVGCILVRDHSLLGISCERKVPSIGKNKVMFVNQMKRDLDEKRPGDRLSRSMLREDNIGPVDPWIFQDQVVGHL